MTRTVHTLVFALVVAALAGACGGNDDTRVVRILRGAGGVGFLPLLIMERLELIEKHAAAAGVDVDVDWLDIGGPAVANDALLADRADFAAAGPPAFLTLWDRGRGSLGVRGVAAMTSMPMYLNTREAHLQRLDDFGPQDKIAVTAVKVSIPAIVMQMYARERHGPAETGRFDRSTVTMAHGDGFRALRAGRVIGAHFTSPPFHQRELKEIPGVRTVISSDEILGGPATFTMLYTTRKFHERRPDVYAVVLAALTEANARIVADPRKAAEHYLSSTGKSSFTLEDILAVLEDPSIRFTTSPENVMKYARFMHEVGTLETAPASWTELFFPEIHDRGGS